MREKSETGNRIIYCDLLNVQDDILRYARLADINKLMDNNAYA